MTGSPSSGDLRLRDLEAAVARLSARLDILEQERPAGAALPLNERALTNPTTDTGAPAADLAIHPIPRDAARASAPGWLGLAGRTCIVLGGAFLLRALTQSGQLPVVAGVWLGLAYAALWLTMAARTAGLSSFFHGITALLVALPLTLEAALTFHVLSAGQSSAVLAVIAVVSLVVAWRRRQRTFAMMTTLGTLLAIFSLAFGSGVLLPPVVALLAVGTAALWVSYGRDWDWLPWPAAAAANLGVIFVAIRASATPPRDEPLAAEAVQGLLTLVYLGSFAIRVLLHERDVRPFELVQTAAALAIGLAGATAIAHSQDLIISAIALPTLFAGGLLYVQTFARVAPRRGFGPEFYYVGMTAMALALVGLSLLFPYPTRPIVIATGALVASLVAWRFGHPMLALQGAIAAGVASAQSGLASFTALVWLTHSQPWPSAGMPIWIVLAAVSAALIVPRAVHDDEPALLSSTARVALSIALIVGAGSLVVIGAGHLMTGVGADPGMLATMKTVILAGAAVGLARVGRSPRFVEFGWLSYGVLAAGGLKILFEDFPTSRPSTLFLALAVYGAALILVPRISKTRS